MFCSKEKDVKDETIVPSQVPFSNFYGWIQDQCAIGITGNKGVAKDLVTSLHQSVFYLVSFCQIKRLAWLNNIN